jgi:hypothetical protein
MSTREDRKIRKPVHNACLNPSSYACCNQVHLRRIPRQYETHHSQHRPHRSLLGAAPLKPLPDPVDLDRHRVRKHAHVGGLINEYHLVA